MRKRAKVPGCVDIYRIKSKRPERQHQVYVVTRAEGNRAVLNVSESFSSTRTAFANIVATARVYRGTVPLIRDWTGPEMVVIEVRQ